MKEILLHICCGVCASSVVQTLRKDRYKPLGFFYNPNIHPEQEYQQRLRVAEKVAQILGFELIKGAYNQDDWFKLTRGLENEPEGAKRCSACFKMRLAQAQAKAAQMSIAKFTTTLTISPHKNTTTINDIGRAMNPSGFFACDFKRQDGFQLAIEFAKRYNLYQQNYCGCVYSKSTKQKC